MRFMSLYWLRLMHFREFTMKTFIKWFILNLIKALNVEKPMPLPLLASHVASTSTIAHFTSIEKQVVVPMSNYKVITNYNKQCLILQK